MPRISETGQFILAAGEVGEFTVCPESWRLRQLSNAQKMRHPNVKRGHELHRQWAKTYDEAVYIRHNARLLIVLILLAIIAHLLTKTGGF